MKYELPSIELIVIEENNYLKFGEYLNDMQCDDTANKLSLDDLEYVKKLQQENKLLKEQVDYLKRSIERKEETIIDLQNERVPYTNEYVEELKKQLEEKENIACNWKDSCLENAGKIEKLENQQKEFIRYMTKTIEELECDDVDDEEMKGYLIQRIDTFKEILSKFKEIIGRRH